MLYEVITHTASPVKMTDLLDGKTFNVSDPSMVEVDVPCGLFRFIDVITSYSIHYTKLYD